MLIVIAREKTKPNGMKTFHVNIAILDKAGRSLLFRWWIWEKTEGGGVM